jgi:hypothetical protein
VSHLKPIDRAAVLVLIPLWIVCFALALRTQVYFYGFAPV